ncbi:NUDIX domain-containing protein [Agrococcus sp. ProA11]|uniref:NUDIX domain-containing protein n=1 Tax=Agrococcus chionoecetis TaxID=3153752 RepID=UPI00326019C0
MSASPAPRPIAIAMLWRADGALLVTSAVEPGTGRTLVRPPGGGLERDEAAADAVVRELREELGVAITVGDLLGEFEHRVAFAGRDLHEVVHVFSATVAVGVSLPPTTDAGHPVWWLEPDRFDEPELEIVPAGLRRLLSERR